MNRRVVVPALFLCAAPWLSGCQATDAIVDYFGPRADPALASLAQAARADSEALKEIDADAASLRAQQAEELYAEIERLCGRNEEGKAPRSCEVDHDIEPREASDVAAVLGDASAATEEQIDHVASESRALVVAQAIALESWNGEEPGDTPELTTAEQDQAAELLEWEYQQVYALDFARSYVTADLEETIDERLSLHEHRILLLQAALAQLGTVPQPAAAYDSPTDGLPNDADSARSFIDEVAHNDTLKWTDAATHAAAASESDSEAEATAAWQRWLIAVAAQSHRLQAA